MILRHIIWETGCFSKVVTLLTSLQELRSHQYVVLALKALSLEALPVQPLSLETLSMEVVALEAISLERFSQIPSLPRMVGLGGSISIKNTFVAAGVI